MTYFLCYCFAILFASSILFAFCCIVSMLWDDDYKKRIDLVIFLLSILIGVMSYFTLETLTYLNKKVEYYEMKLPYEKTYDYERAFNNYVNNKDTQMQIEKIYDYGEVQ